MNIPLIWLGSDESYTQHLLNRVGFLANRAAFAEREVALREQLDEEETNLSDYLASRMTERVGNVGLVKISGSLTSEESIYNLWFGETAYQTVAHAVRDLLADSNVHSILTVWDTPGGDANGVNDFGSFLKDARKVKPVHAWTGTMALSAGYWGAACCQSIRASALGETGSIGAVAKFRSYARLLEEEGIDTVIARSAPMKAILQSEEPVDDQKRAYLQAKVDKLHTYFVDHIRGSRAKLRDRDSAQWATGATFYADEAIALGLVDGPEISLNALVSKLQASADTARSTTGTRTMNTVLSDQMVAQMLSGLPQVTAGEPAPAPAPDPAPVEVPPEEAPRPFEDAPDLRAGEPLVGYLQSRVVELEARVIELSLKSQSAEAKLAEVSGLEEALRPVVITATTNLQVALGQAPQVFNDVPTRAIANTFHALSDEAHRRFPVGRQSTQAHDESRQPASLAELRLISSAK